MRCARSLHSGSSRLELALGSALLYVSETVGRLIMTKLALIMVVCTTSSLIPGGQAGTISAADACDRLNMPTRTVANRDKSGTSAPSENNTGSQAVVNQQLASRVSFEAERTGFEPAEGCDPFTDLANRRFRPLSHLSKMRFFCGPVSTTQRSWPPGL